MAQQIFVNLPVKNLDKSIAFFKRARLHLPSPVHRQECDLHDRQRQYFRHVAGSGIFQDLQPNSISDANKATEVLMCLSCDSHE